ncbi:hypothetical protein PCYB_001960 [Plasmodium cynomolgi strain B]|uniref:Uncharacterized protein n=1 Tax=Plasmodium cynomolgi (strain B) TaxID=1120755 RepID=K6UNF8_PLACD|nr:hypothetical protein PCYB_001960 [Plasmodium cynomolgi strain B]GAB69448.1 hypothetical protein PCYB_001960 [Plasmodium cynomolgi strain B]
MTYPNYLLKRNKTEILRNVTANVDLGCLGVNDDIEDELRRKFAKLDSSNGTYDINEQKNIYNVCYEHRYKQCFWYTPKIIKKFLSESMKYHICPQQWIWEPEEATKLTVKEEESHGENEKQTSTENISEFSQKSALTRKFIFNS